jgi:hypothetical protein
MSKEHDQAIQNHLTTHLANNIIVGQDEESNKFMQTQANLLSAINWNLFFLPLGTIAILVLQEVIISQAGHNTLFSILGGISLVVLLRLTRRSIEKSFYQSRSNEVSQATRVIAKYISNVGAANGISLNSTGSDKDGTAGLQATSEENKDSIR